MNNVLRLRGLHLTWPWAERQTFQRIEVLTLAAAKLAAIVEWSYSIPRSEYSRLARMRNLSEAMTALRIRRNHGRDYGHKLVELDELFDQCDDVLKLIVENDGHAGEFASEVHRLLGYHVGAIDMLPFEGQRKSEIARSVLKVYLVALEEVNSGKDFTRI